MSLTAAAVRVLSEIVSRLESLSIDEAKSVVSALLDTPFALGAKSAQRPAQHRRKVGATPGANESAQVVSFEKFYSEYPKKRDRVEALKEWIKLDPTEPLVGQILQALAEQKTWPEWLKNEGEFIPYAKTWIRGRKWENRRGANPAQPSAQDGRATGANVGADGFTLGAPHGIWVKGNQVQ